MSIGLTTSLPPSAARASDARPVTMKAYLPLYLYAVSLASLLTVTGILWDISWHRSIGRDKFLSPPHILIYLGAIFAGLFSGIQVIWNSIRPTETVKASTVRVWGIFYSSLGALFCIWGAIAMLTSAPFDDWWHSAYGLDVTILSPPHTLLGLGMLFLQFGACVGVSKYLNTGGTGRKGLLRILFIVSAASLLTMIYTLGTEFLHTRGMRGGLFYIVAAVTTLLFLPVFGRALRMNGSRYACSIRQGPPATQKAWSIVTAAPIFRRSATASASDSHSTASTFGHCRCSTVPGGLIHGQLSPLAARRYVFARSSRHGSSG